MSRSVLTRQVAAILVSLGVGGVAPAADLTTERTSLPDYCSNRDVTCVVPDGPPPPVRAAAPVRATTAGSSATVEASGQSAGETTTAATPSATGPALRPNPGRAGSWSGAGR